MWMLNHPFKSIKKNTPKKMKKLAIYHRSVYWYGYNHFHQKINEDFNRKW